jgi:hypothetical protein
MTYFRLMDCNGNLKHGSPCPIETEKRRASLIAEAQLKLTIERSSLACDLGYLTQAKWRAASIRLARPRIARALAEIKFWKTAEVEMSI